MVTYQIETITSTYLHLNHLDRTDTRLKKESIFLLKQKPGKAGILQLFGHFSMHPINPLHEQNLLLYQ